MKPFLSLLAAAALTANVAATLHAAGTDDVLRIHHAVEIEHESEHGHSYLLQVSTNLVDWHDVGEPEPGHGGRDRRLFPARDDNGAPRFYRVQVMDGPTNGLAPSTFTALRLQMDDQPGGELMDFLTGTNGVDLSEEKSDAFSYQFRQFTGNVVRLEIGYSATRSNGVTLSFTATNSGIWITEEYRKGRLKDRNTGLFRVLADAAGSPVVVSTNGPIGGGSTASEPPAPPASLSGMRYYFQATGVADQYAFSNAAAGVEIQGLVDEGSPTNGFAYAYTVLGTNTASLVLNFGYYGAGGDRYECDLTFTGGPSGRFVRREFRKGRLKDTDTGAFSPQTLSGANDPTVPMTDIAATNPPPTSPVGLTFTMLGGNPTERLAFATATTGVQRDDSAPSDFTYTYASTGPDKFSLVVRFKTDSWDEYSLVFTDGARGTFVRREFRNGTLKGTDSAKFIIATTAP